MITRTPTTRLVQTAAAQNTLDGIGEMLRVVTEEMDSWGTLVWVAGPNSDPAAGTGRLFVLAYWVPDETIRVWHVLSFDSAAGYVLRTKQAMSSAVDDARIGKPTPSLIIESRTKQFCLAPMTMEDGSDAVMEVYRKEDRPFTPNEIDLLGQLAAILPALYANLTERVGVKLVDDVWEVLHDRDRRRESDKAVFENIIERIDNVFRSLHVSMFLEGADEEPGFCGLVAHRTVWGKDWTDKDEYRRGEGATGYVLDTGKTVRIVDLARYDEDREWISERYPGLQWNNSLKIESRARTFFGLKDEEASPPLSWVGAPIRSGATTFGVIRCSGSQRNPFYFDQWHARFLGSIGIEIGAWWRNVLESRELLAWKNLVAGFQQMNKFVQKQLGQRAWDETQFFLRAMELAHKVIPNTDNSDVRLIDGNELVQVAIVGDDWASSHRARARERIRPPGSAAAYIVAEKKGVQVYDDANQAPYFNKSLPGTRKLILAPIEAGDKVYGVLTIRSESSKPFLTNVNLIAGLLGQQLGLFHSLALQIRSLQKAEAETNKIMETQVRTIGDVHHQVKSPIISAHRAAQGVISSRELPQILRADVEQIKGLCSKVSRVVRNMGVFADLSAQKPVRLANGLLVKQKLGQMLRDACFDHENLIDPQRRILFRLDEKSLQPLSGPLMAGRWVELDWPLVEQCVNNLLDNAAKYSYDNTEVRISCGLQANNSEFFISVANEGFEVKPEEVQKLKQRGFRADEAVWATGEGSGIGLWIVDEIMKAHKGYLAITPTTNGITDVRMAFRVVTEASKLSV